VGELRTFLFGLVNFVVLIGALVWLLRPAAHQFFYARRLRIRKQMFSSVVALRTARARAAASRAAHGRIPEEIAERRRIIEARCHEDCDDAIAEARRRATHLLEEAERAAHEERERAVQHVRAEMIERAFALASEQLRGGAGPDAQRRYLARGMAEIASLVGGGR
jgi:F0F1-type ATP synthase membrane subunit b/b'